MTNENEISSTERLLNVIRRSADQPGSAVPKDPGAGFNRPPKPGWLPGRSRDYLGVEILRDRLHLVCMTREKHHWQIVDAASFSLPEGLSLEHQDFPLFLKTRIQQVIRSRKNEIWVCLPPSKGEIWTVHVPKVKKGLTNAVYWSARREKTFDENEYFFDYRIRDEIADQGIQKLVAEVCIASAKQIRLYRKIFSDIGYRLTGATLPAYCLENLFVHNWIDPGDEAYAVLYIGDEASYIGIHGRRSTLFNRVIKTGRDSVLDSTIMGSRPRAPDPELFGMIRPALERLARQMERTIDHSVNVLNNPAPERIYICGGISSIPGLAEFFGEQLGIPAVIMDIPNAQWHAAAGGSPALTPEARADLVSAAALAMPSNKTINFLNTALDRDREREALRNANIVAAACAILFVLSAGYWWMARHDLQQAHKQTQAVQQQLEQYTPRVHAEDLARLAGKLEGERDRLKDFSRKLQAVAVLKELNRVTPEYIKLVNVRLNQEDGGRGGRNNRAGRLRVEGFIMSAPELFETHLTGYLLKLRRSPLFLDSTIRDSGPDTRKAEDAVYRFTLDIDLAQV